MAIASLTKIMTAIIVEEFFQDSERIQISKQAVEQEGWTGDLRTGEVLTAEDLLHIMLIESSNDAAFALAEIIGEDGLTELMNLKARDLGLLDTLFFNSTGLDPEKESHEVNYSTCQDLAGLGKYLLKKLHLLEITTKEEYPLFLKNGILHHILYNTNELLGENPAIIGGKTGFTEKAGGCLILILEGKKPGSYLINVVLNSADRFGDMRKLIAYVTDKRY